MSTNKWIDQPIFIVGYPKSGTSLLLSLLDGHPELIVIPEETDFYTVIYQHLKLLNLDKLKLEDKLTVLKSLIMRTHLRYIVSSSSGSYIGGNYDYTRFEKEIFWKEFKNYLLENGFSYSNIMRAIVNAYDKASPLDRRKKSVKAWIEKTPGHEYCATLFKNWFNKAKFIHLVRDPRDNWASYKRKHPKLKISQFAASYNASIKTGFKNKELFLGDYILIRYEDLLSDPVNTMEKISNFIGIRFSNMLLIPSKFGVTWEGNSMWGERYTKISTSPIGRYKKYLTNKEISFIECTIDHIFDQNWYYRRRCSNVQKFINTVRILICSFASTIQIGLQKFRLRTVYQIKRILKKQIFNENL